MHKNYTCKESHIVTKMYQLNSLTNEQRIEQLSLNEDKKINSKETGIYFSGSDPNESSKAKANFRDYDDELGFYRTTPHDHINYRYEILTTISRGLFSEVVHALDHKDQRSVVIKIFTSTDESLLIFYEETHKLHVLSQYSNEDYTVKMFEYFIFRGHPCIVLEALLDNLRKELEKITLYGFPLKVVKEILISVLQGLTILKRMKLVHCDLKPENLAFVKEGHHNVKILDFGNSVFVNEQHLSCSKFQMQCAPEIALQLPFGTQSDIWSLGCLAVTIYTGRIIFTADTIEDQLASIASVIGLPPEKILNTKEGREFFNSNGYPKHLNKCSKVFRRFFRKNKSLPKSLSLSAILRDSESPDFIDFVEKCLQWEPEKRMTPKEALNHVWLRDDVINKFQQLT